MKWPIVSLRRHERELEDLKADRERIRGERDQFAKDRDAQRAVARTATRQFAEADATNRRLAGRNRALAEQLEAAQVGSGFNAAKAQQTANRIERLRRAVAKARREAAEAATRPGADRARLVTELQLAQRAHRSLDEHARTLQAANEALTRELHDTRQDEEVSS
ncbi:hypothetical protein AB0N17_03335 [Streptomyces sp. NPDC051133]|uniref:hypothetical protein n=1 Tax=Streptomyces sp. NPDC051133 TaxID=3155521 RepID=UPI003417933D